MIDSIYRQQKCDDLFSFPIMLIHLSRGMTSTDAKLKNDYGIAEKLTRGEILEWNTFKMEQKLERKTSGIFKK